MNIPEVVLRYAKQLVNDPFRTYDKKDLEYQRGRCLDEIKKYKELKSIISEAEKRRDEITSWLKEVEIKIASPEEISIIKEKLTR